MKYEMFQKLIQNMGTCSKCTNLKCKNKSLINIYQDYDFCTNIPSIWTDWFNRLNSNIMIIGQDWGPYSDMKKFYNLLNTDKSNWQELIDKEQSLTKKMLEKYISISSNNKNSLNDIYVTNAIMCARQGNTYRGNNIDLKKSTLNCNEYLLRQIEIVKPKVVLTLGYYPLLSLAKIFEFNIEKTLNETILKFPEIVVNDFIIIPLYHPVAQVKKEEQLKQYRRIWKYIDIKIQNNSEEGLKMKKRNEIKVNKENELVDVENIYQNIRNKIIVARERMLKHIDTTMMEVYWNVGRITYELSENSTKASYGKKIIEALSQKLTNEFCNGFSPVSIRRMRKFYEIYPIWSAVPIELSWSHFQELIRIDRKEEREFYENEAIKSNWGYRELNRQINTKLYDRYLISPSKSLTMEESKKGLIEKHPEELLKTPYIFEFAGLKENKNYLETDLESALLSHLTEFLLELGRGFSFVSSQQRIKIGLEYYYPDLIFYNRLAKCFVIIDLKIGKLTHQDIGQMQMYVNYYKKTQMIDGENSPIGILLCADKDDAVVEMTLGDSVKNVYASKYLTYLPTKEELIKIIKDEKELYELSKKEGEKDERK